MPFEPKKSKKKKVQIWPTEIALYIFVVHFLILTEARDFFSQFFFVRFGEMPFHSLPSFFFLGVLCLGLFLGGGETCSRISVSSQNFGDLIFVLDGRVSNSDRPIYREVVEQQEGEETPAPRFFYHMFAEPFEEGLGRWFIGHDLESSSGVAFVDSWAVVPQAIQEMSPLAKWKSYAWGTWREEEDVKIVCLDDYDQTLFLCSNLNKGVCGFYFPIVLPKKEGEAPIFHSTNGRELYWLEDVSRWMVSEDGVGATSGISYIDCGATNPEEIATSCPKRSWKSLTNEGWIKDYGFVLLGGTKKGEASVFSRRRTFLNPALETKDMREYTILSNGVYLPLIGLGTGGLSREETRSVISTAVKDHGYELIDTASQYFNEDVISEALRESHIGRSQVIVSSKVWPTRLGFRPTSHTIEEGLDNLRSGYFDVYLLHWPFCYDNIEWMDCPPNPSGTWQQSWRALEKAYAEGIVRAIGVSNFDERLMEELVEFGSVPPHLVQNWMDPLHVNQEVLSICKTHRTMFQAYSMVREWVGRGTSGDRKTKQTIRFHATQNKITTSELLLRWALQFGTERAGVPLGVVVRSKTRAHLGSNLAVTRREPLSFEAMRDLSALQFLQFRNEL